VSFYGAYEDAEKEGRQHGRPTPAITWGHSKDHRPDLKQLLYTLTISEDGGVPVYFTTASGNVVDDRTHCQTWDLLHTLVGRPEFLYVADCKLASSENLNHIASRGGRFVTVLPRTYKEDGVFRARLRESPSSVTWRKLYAVAVMQDMMTKLKLTVNAAKTQLCRLPDEPFDFLGYTIGPCWSWKRRRMVLSTRPSKKAVKRLQAKISEATGRNQTLLDEETVVKRLNRMLTGWANYFRRGPVSAAYRNIDLHVRRQIRKWLVAKHKERGRGIERYPDTYLFRELGLVQLTAVRTRHLRGRNA
jgi:Group II intron, maturase-specific domain